MQTYLLYRYPCLWYFDCRQLNHTGDWNFGLDDKFQFGGESELPKSVSSESVSSNDSVGQTQLFIEEKISVIPKFKDLMFTWLASQMSCSTSALVSIYHLKLTALELHVQSIANQVKENKLSLDALISTSCNEYCQDLEEEMLQDRVNLHDQKQKDTAEEKKKNVGRIIANLALEKLLDAGIEILPMQKEVLHPGSFKNVKISTTNRQNLSLASITASPHVPSTILVSQLKSSPLKKVCSPQYYPPARGFPNAGVDDDSTFEFNPIPMCYPKQFKANTSPFPEIPQSVAPGQVDGLVSPGPSVFESQILTTLPNDWTPGVCSSLTHCAEDEELPHEEVWKRDDSDKIR